VDAARDSLFGLSVFTGWRQATIAAARAASSALGPSVLRLVAAASSSVRDGSRGTQ